MLKRQLHRMFIRLCIHWLVLPLLCAMCALPVHVSCACAAGQCNVSLPPRKHTGGQVQSPPPGVLAWVGGWHGVAREWDSYIYLNLYTSFHIAFLIIGK